MSRNSRAAPPFEDRHRSDWRGPNGRRCCRWCGVEVPKGRQSWCSDGCVTAYTDTFWATLRRAVLERDRGVCQLCGTDTRDLLRRLQAERLRIWAALHGPPPPYMAAVYDHHEPSIAETLRRMGDLRSWPRRTDRDWWEADHVQPVVEGGKDQLDNLRTLCVPCHKAETAALAARRARRRRDAALAEKRARWDGAA